MHCGDALEILPTLPESSVHLILTDPPYHRVKAEAWDRQWRTDADYLAWVGRLCDEWRRVLAPNGSLYVFASPKMAARVECVVGERFEVLNRITWVKNDGDVVNSGGKWRQSCKEALRSYFPRTEAIVFAEHFGAHACSPVGAVIAAARAGAGLRNFEVDIALGYIRKNECRGTYLCRRWEEGSSVPTEDDFCRAMTVCGDRRPASVLGEQYRRLVREYHASRRPFAVSSSVPYTDIWDFPTVPARPGKHPCEKPLAMMEHVVAASSRPGDTVLDCFMGSGVVGEACRNLGRSFIGIDGDPKWVSRASRRVDAALAASPLFV
jgi:adenine-specific DNA-methyltransferase